MTQEQKDLLLKDLCARLPYGVICEGKYSDAEYDIDGGIEMFDAHGVLEAISMDEAVINSYCCDIETVKPYLRPMSSMTEEEKKEFIKVSGYVVEESVNERHDKFFLSDYVGKPNEPTANFDAIDWLNKNKFDYRDLIPMGLAIAVTEENNPYK